MSTTIAGCQNDGNYTAPDGLNFTMYCNENIAAAAYSTSAPTTKINLTQCMNTCSQEDYYCYGVVYQPSNSSCWELTNLTASTESNLETNSKMAVALADPNQLSLANTSCPYANNSVQTSSAGVDFTIKCSMAVPTGAYCPWSSEFCPTHVDTLDECMDICAAAHPLCESASWNPGMIHGYQNCYLKTASQPLEEYDLTTQSYILHTAVLNLPTLAQGCPTDKNYTSTANGTDTAFTISCGQQATSATNLTFSHQPNITACMDSCASYSDSPSCEAVVFDPSMAIGYDNCQLLNSVTLVQDTSNVNYASISSSNSSDASGVSSSSSGHSSSKAWIAGPVIGGIVAIALVALILWWWCRRKKSSAQTAAAASTPAYITAPQAEYVPSRQQQGATELPPKSPVDRPALHEMSAAEGRVVHEMDA
ncbi:uncharacterized protein BHQ10_003912 [Talaromyces amestolkiae]|uniref:Apple domain-containing protein n=1 Tax=Talaromyces amestolkiae TaxID=1196081 RepID=A0A364KWH3_TALAM|nr:uncharacterized protein BHQ10_003912 [Talaromyces amestolkiae]RAO67900.1 hypothetical protein BHQ10_003912 [Talaromyces amestolkiae]